MIAINPDSELLPVARAGGVLTALSVPRGGLIAGTSAVIQLDGFSNDDMAVMPAAGVHLYWPGPYPIQPFYPQEAFTLTVEQREKAIQYASGIPIISSVAVTINARRTVSQNACQSMRRQCNCCCH